MKISDILVQLQGQNCAGYMQGLFGHFCTIRENKKLGWQWCDAINKIWGQIHKEHKIVEGVDRILDGPCDKMNVGSIT